MVGPARPLLHRTGSPLHSIYHRGFDELPLFPHTSLEDEELQQNRTIRPGLTEKRCYLVYRREIAETWNFTLTKQQQTSVPPLPSTDERVLQFESNFESGNLKQAEKVWGEEEYNLTMQRDINTYGFTQWFFFRVSSAVPHKQYKFNIVNFYKGSSLFQKGMKVLVYSVKQQQHTRRGWHRDGTDIHYFRNGTVEEVGEGRTKQYFTLSFHYSFRHDNDEVFFAYNYPYTYTELNCTLDRLEQQHQSIMHRTLLTRTLAGNRVELLTISNFANSRPKKGIFITGRTHPGETVSSYIVKGVIDFLTSDDEEAFQLRDNFVFKVVPMVNPDGVIHGNYRSNLSGSDLNRKWEAPSKRLHPQIYHLKKNILEFAERSPILMFCDMHGHSRKKNAFIYGCTDKTNPYKTREFPFLVSKASKSFSFEDCTFGIKSGKKGTARAVLWKKLAIPNIFTLETSFCGPAQPQVHFGYRHFEEIGKRFCQTLLLHFHDQITSHDVSITSSPLPGIRMSKRNDFLNELYTEQRYATMGNGSDESDSSASIDEMSERTILKLENGIVPKERPVVKRSLSKEKIEEKSPTISLTRQKLRERRSEGKTRRDTSSPNRTQHNRGRLQRDKERQRLPYMCLQPKMFTIVEPESRQRQWNFSNYQENLSHNMTHNTITNTITNFNYKSYSFGNRRSLKLSSPRNKNSTRRLDRVATVFNDSKVFEENYGQVGRRIKTQTVEQPSRNSTLHFEVRLKQPRRIRPSYN